MPPSSAGSGRRIACWTLSLIVMSAPSRRLRTVAANTARTPATATVPKRYPSSRGAGGTGDHRHHGVQGERVAGDQRGHPAVAPRAGQQRAHREQAGQVEAAAPIRIPVTAMTASSTRAIIIQTGCCPMALVARRSSRRMRPHPSYPCDEILTYWNSARFASFTPSRKWDEHRCATALAGLPAQSVRDKKMIFPSESRYACNFTVYAAARNGARPDDFRPAGSSYW